MSVHKIMVQHWLIVSLRFTELFFKVWIESAASWRVPLRASKSWLSALTAIILGKSSATIKNMTWGRWENTTKKYVYACMVCYLWISMTGCVCRCPKRISATWFFSSVLGTTWSHRWSHSSARNPPTGCFVPHVSNLSKWMIFLYILHIIAIHAPNPHTTGI